MHHRCHSTHRCCPCSSTSMRRRCPCSLTSVCRRCLCSSTSPDHQRRPLATDIERSRTSIITCQRPSSPDPPGATPPLPGRTLHHESPDPSSDPISAPEADVIHGRVDAMRHATLRAGSVPRSPPMMWTSLLGGPPSNPWEGHRLKTRSALHYDGSSSSTATTDGDVNRPLHPRPTMSTMASRDPSHTV
jgi:hypothetical protein